MPGAYIRTPEVRSKQSLTMKARAAQGLQARGWKLSDERRHQISKMAKQRTGERNPFFGKVHSEESKVKMGFSKTGIARDAGERRAHRDSYNDVWRNENPEKIKVYDTKSLPVRAAANARRRKQLRVDVINKLGGRCVGKNCRWVNEDGSLGCSDARILHVDHIDGGGTKERNFVYYERMLQGILNDSSKYQLLCPNCNWLKAIEKREFPRKYEEVEICCSAE